MMPFPGETGRVLRVGTNFGNFTIYVICKRCAHEGKVTSRDLQKYGRAAPVSPLMRKLRCRACGSRDTWWRVRMRLNMR